MYLQLRVLLFVGLIATNSVAADLAKILREPKRYYDQKIVVEGTARVGGSLYLYSDIAAAAQRQVTKAALIILKDSDDWTLDESAPERTLDRKRIRVVGTVLHEEALDFRCAIKAETLEIVDPTPDRRIKEEWITGIFENGLAKDVAVELSRPGHEPNSEFYVEAHSVTRTVMRLGDEATVSSLAGPSDLRIDKRKKERLVFKGTLPAPNLPPDYVYSAADDPVRQVYYRIVDGRIELDKPAKPK